MTARTSPYPGSLRRISYKEFGVRLLTPPNAVIAAPTHPVTSPEDVLEHFESYFDLDAASTYVIATNQVEDLDNFMRGQKAKALVNLHRVNDIRRVNKFFEAAHEKLEDDAHFVVCVETLRNWRRNIRLRFRWPFADLYIATAFVLKRVLPKLRLTRGLYFFATQGRNRLMSRAETMGRLYCCGFKVVATRRIDHLTFIVTQKVKAPSFDMSPSYGPIFRMRRVGRHGKTIWVYKLRTMFPYAEYLQQYVYEQNTLAEGGKLKDDFRVTPWGKVFRRLWIDELPMLINWVRGELKLVGVRPLSFHYEGMYPADLREMRRRTTPGLIPPFYADLPKTFDDIVESERAYLRAYDRNPWRTDAIYLAKAILNIVFRGARSR